MNEKKDKKVSFKPTLMDQALMEKIGWSEEDVQSFVEDIDEEEKVGTMKEEQKVATMQEGISGAPGFFFARLGKADCCSEQNHTRTESENEQK